MRLLESAINLPVADAARAYEFYRKVFGESYAVIEENIVSLRVGGALFFFIENAGFELIMKPTREMPEFATEKYTALLSVTVDTRDAVYEMLKRAADEGGAPCGQAVHYAWGTAAYFTDPDRHLWEAIWRK